MRVRYFLPPILSFLCLAMSPSSPPQGSAWPVLYEDDFEDGAARWQPFDPTAWKIEKAERGHVYSQFRKETSYEPPHSSPRHISLLEGIQVTNFELTVQVLSTHADYDHRDACLVFGYQDPAHFYYVHLGKKTDDHANQIFIVDGADRTKVSTETTAGTDWDDEWHTVRITRRVGEGTIEVYFDDMDEPVMRAVDDTFVRGRVGLGSFDDTTDWDDFRLRGVEAEPRQ